MKNVDKCQEKTKVRKLGSLEVKCVGSDDPTHKCWFQSYLILPPELMLIDNLCLHILSNFY